MREALKIVLLGALFGAAASRARDMLTRDAVTGESATGQDFSDYGAEVIDQGAAFLEDIDFMTAQSNLDAFLMAIRHGEGTSAGNGFSILCGGVQFDTYQDHPAKLGWRGLPLSDRMCSLAGFGPGCVSTAAGAYQINRPTWNRLAAKLGLQDFSPESQTAAAVELISEKGALGDVHAGRIPPAVAKVRKIWASLPGAGYGQYEMGLNIFVGKFTDAGGVIA